LSAPRLVRLVEGGVLQPDDLRRIARRGICDSARLSFGAERRLVEAVRAHVRVMGYSDPWNAPAKALLAKTTRAAARSNALLTALVRAWADLEIALCSDVQEFLASGKRPTPILSPDRHHPWQAVEILEVADAFSYGHRTYSRADVILMICWLTRSAPSAPEWRRTFSRERANESHPASTPESSVPDDSSTLADWTVQQPPASASDLELVEVLQSLGSLPAESPDWPTLGRLATSLKDICDQKTRELEERRARFRDAWAGLLEGARDTLLFFGFGDLLSWSGADAPDALLDEVTDLIQSMTTRLRTYGQLGARSGESLVHDLRRRAQMQDIEQSLLAAHERLVKVFAPLAQLQEAGPLAETEAPSSSRETATSVESALPVGGHGDAASRPPEAPDSARERREIPATATTPGPAKNAPVPDIESSPPPAGEAPDEARTGIPVLPEYGAGSGPQERAPSTRASNGLPQSIPPSEAGSPWLERPSAWEPIQSGDTDQLPQDAERRPDATHTVGGVVGLLAWLRGLPGVKT